MRWQTGAAVALLAALATVAVIAFAQDGGTPEVEATAPPTVTASPSPSPATPSPSPIPSPELVLPDNDVEDPLEAIVAIAAYRDYLLAHPDPAGVRFIFHPECFCSDPLREFLDGLAREDRRVVMDGSTIVSDQVLEEQQTDRVVVVRYSASTPAFKIVDADGQTIEEHEHGVSRSFRAQLSRGDGGRWIVVHLEETS